MIILYHFLIKFLIKILINSSKTIFNDILTINVIRKFPKEIKINVIISNLTLTKKPKKDKVLNICDKQTIVNPALLIAVINLKLIILL